MLGVVKGSEAWRSTVGDSVGRGGGNVVDLCVCAMWRSAAATLGEPRAHGAALWRYDSRKSCRLQAMEGPTLL